MDIYKGILNEIAKPIVDLNKLQIQTILDKLRNGGDEEILVADSLERLYRYIYLSFQLSKEQEKNLLKFIDDIEKIQE